MLFLTIHKRQLLEHLDSPKLHFLEFFLPPNKNGQLAAIFTLSEAVPGWPWWLDRIFPADLTRVDQIFIWDMGLNPRPGCASSFRGRSWNREDHKLKNVQAGYIWPCVLESSESQFAERGRKIDSLWGRIKEHKLPLPGGFRFLIPMSRPSSTAYPFFFFPCETPGLVWSKFHLLQSKSLGRPNLRQGIQ